MAVIQIKALCKHHHAWFNNDKIISIAADVAVILISRYQNEDWYVKTNYRQAIYLQCMKQMFDPRMQDKDMLEIKPNQPDRTEIDAIPYDQAYRELDAATKNINILLQLAARYKSMAYYLRAIAKYQSIQWIRSHARALRVIYEYRETV